MLKIITDRRLVARCRGRFLAGLRPFWDRRVPVCIGHPGGRFPARVHWSERLGLWMCHRRTEEGQIWTLLGTERPEEGAVVSITCELNVPAEGRDRRVGAAFGRDARGRVFLVHRGRLGGGQRGMGKKIFLERFRGVWTDLDEGDGVAEVAVVCCLGSRSLADQVSLFVHKVAAVKAEVRDERSPQLAIPLEAGGFQIRRIGGSGAEEGFDLAGRCDHGPLVLALAGALRGRGYRPANDDGGDLYLSSAGGDKGAVFRVVTGGGGDTVRREAALLLWEGAGRTDHPLLVLVLPRSPTPEEAAELRARGIETLAYGWEGSDAVFPQLDDLFPPRPPREASPKKKR
ncbi:MAG TPA: hypothetical protein PK836_04130 [Syntrophales bacterium]|nr:hypothetical protein [Syntrophales bacterium]HPC00854.1 hypothetical protein [Syntrophales bacterium]HPQ07116.1 hypothetical protein [Syntrophales bacterium]HRV43033.1 hypothetical protein [Syntrophales bacterium]